MPQSPGDEGRNPFVTNIEEATLDNDSFRIALWTDRICS